MDKPQLRITIWNEFVHERRNAEVTKVYPNGIHEAIADGLREHLGDEGAIRTATLDQPNIGLDQATLDSTDVLFWWGHVAHGEVPEVVVDAIQHRVLRGMGLIALHSAHDSRPFKRLMGTACQLRWREAGERERIWIVDPSHPIVDGLSTECFEIPHTEMYGEPFGIPTPDELICISGYAGGEVFRSGCTFRRGLGKIFYFGPGHETYPIYYDPQVRRILANAARWCWTRNGHYPLECRQA